MSSMSNFVHLHTHTEYSFLDGAIRIGDLVGRASELGMPALAITDHGGLFGAVEFYDKCMAKGIKPVIGFEAYMAPGSRFEKASAGDERSNYHLVLLARNKEGYRNLMRLSSIGYREGFYYKPRIDMEVLQRHSTGIIAMTACIAGSVPRLLLEGKRDRAGTLAREFLKIFGEENFYFELQDHGIDEEKTAFEEMIELGRELGIPFVLTNDAHYLNRRDAESHEILLCIQTQTTMADPKRYRFSSDQIYLKSPEEMAKLFPEIPEAVSNTLSIAERCNVDVHERFVLPVPALPRGFSGADDYLAHLARKGLTAKYSHVTPGIEERLEYELKVIRSMGFPGYFLIVADFVQAAKRMGIVVGCRGSAAGSLVAYCLGITDVDPIRFDLIFERFLNPERVSMPDADIDFADKDRYRVIDYVVEKYGRESVCQIINFGRMKAKMVVKDVARAMGVSVAEANKLSAMINEKTLKASLESNGELARTVRENETYGELFRHARALEGLARQAGMHAGGVIIAPGEVVQWAPLYKPSNSEIVMSQFDMNYVEKAGLIKMDFLGLRTLTVLQEALRLIARYHGKAIDLWSLPDGDKETMALFGRGETVGIFQFESQGMQDNLRKLKPEGIDDLIAMNALYRPGPMEDIPTYIHRKHGKEEVSYAHPLLEEVLKITHGVIVYQEQVMRIAQIMGGFTLGQADILRKAMGKKKLDQMENMRARFLEGAAARNVTKETAEEVFDRMAKFAQYAFNKAHATVYAHVAYQSGYLKAYYPLEYMTANLTSWLGNQESMLTIRNEAERMGIKLLPPDINSSDMECSVDGKNIRLGLGAIKNVGKAGEAIIEARKNHGPFRSIFHLCRWVDLRHLNKKALESLVFAGALDSLKATRARLHAAIDRAFEYGGSFQKDRLTGQVSLFDELGDSSEAASEAVSVPEPELPDVQAWPYSELLAREKEVLNFYVSGHPLDRFQDEIRGFASHRLDTESLKGLKDGDALTVGGMVAGLKTHVQRNGKEMAFAVLEDFDGSIELLVFAETYEKYRGILAKDAMILAHGFVSRRESDSGPKIRVDKIMALSESREKLAHSVHIKVSTQGLETDFVREIGKDCTRFAGSCPLIIHLVTHEQNEYRIRSRKYRLSPTDDTLRTLRGRLGKENVWLSKTAA